MRKAISLLSLLMCISLATPAISADDLSSLRDENKRLASMLMNKNMNSCNDAGENITDNVADDLSSLRDENKRLQLALNKIISQTGSSESQSQSQSQSQSLENTCLETSDSLLKKKDDEIARLRKNIYSLQVENKKMVKSLSGGTLATNIEVTNIGGGLKNQIQSLRDTIKAQNEMLVSADNAIKASEKLLLENTMLQQKLKQAESANAANVEIATALADRNNSLQKEVAQRDAYISKQEGLSDDKYALSQAQNMKAKIVHLLKKNKELKSSLNKERKSSISDRVAMQQCRSRNGADSFSSYGDDENISKKISYYKSNIAYLEAGMELRNKEISLLKLENQDLMARLSLSSDEHIFEDFESDDPFYSPTKNDGDLNIFDDDMVAQ